MKVPTRAELHQATDAYMAASDRMRTANRALDLSTKRRIKSAAMSDYNRARARFQRVADAIRENRPVRKTRQTVDFETTIGTGIPVGVVVGHISAYYPATWHSPAEDEEAEFDIVDRRGYPGAWLDRHITEADEIRIEVECLEWAHDQRMSALEDEADARIQERKEMMMECA